jgi:hypothetical protein
MLPQGLWQACLVDYAGPYYRSFLKAYSRFTWRMARYIYTTRSFVQNWLSFLYDVSQQWQNHTLYHAAAAQPAVVVGVALLTCTMAVVVARCISRQRP